LRWQYSRAATSPTAPLHRVAAHVSSSRSRSPGGRSASPPSTESTSSGAASASRRRPAAARRRAARPARWPPGARRRSRRPTGHCAAVASPWASGPPRTAPRPARRAPGARRRRPSARSARCAARSTGTVRVRPSAPNRPRPGPAPSGRRLAGSHQQMSSTFTPSATRPSTSSGSGSSCSAARDQHGPFTLRSLPAARPRLVGDLELRGVLLDHAPPRLDVRTSIASSVGSARSRNASRAPEIQPDGVSRSFKRHAPTRPVPPMDAPRRPPTGTATRASRRSRHSKVSSASSPAGRWAPRLGRTRMARPGRQTMRPASPPRPQPADSTFQRSASERGYAHTVHMHNL